MTAAAPTHVGQHGLDHRDRAEQVDLELPAHLGQRRLLEDAFMTIAGTVHQHVQRTDVALDGCDRWLDGGKVGDVQQPAEGLARRHGFQCAPGLLAAHRAPHAVTGVQRLAGQGLAEAAAGAGDQQGFAKRHGDDSVTGE